MKDWKPKVGTESTTFAPPKMFIYNVSYLSAIILPNGGDSFERINDDDIVDCASNWFFCDRIRHFLTPIGLL
jgi:hypothetical protein